MSLLDDIIEASESAIAASEFFHRHPRVQENGTLYVTMEEFDGIYHWAVDRDLSFSDRHPKSSIYYISLVVVEPDDPRLVPQSNAEPRNG